MPFAYKLKYLPVTMLGVASIANLPRETSSRHFWVGGFSSSTFHPWQFDTFWNPKQNAFINKNRNEQDLKEIFLFCIFFPTCFAICCWCVCFQYFIFFDCTILRKYLYKTLSVASKTAIHTPKTHMRVNNSNFFTKIKERIVGSILLLLKLIC